MKAREYRVLEHAIEVGVEYGWNRAHKHVDAPSPEAIQNAVCAAVMNEITEWFEFDSEGVLSDG